MPSKQTNKDIKDFRMFLSYGPANKLKYFSFFVTSVTPEKDVFRHLRLSHFLTPKYIYNHLKYQVRALRINDELYFI